MTESAKSNNDVPLEASIPEGAVPLESILCTVAVSVFPGEQYQAPRTWAEKAYPNLIYFHEVDKGGHFAAWEQPGLFSEEVRAAFRSLR
jgi:pimeloyl-ACP methyl ester carboxylesterase